MALGLRPGDEVLCSAFGFPASPSSIILAGGHPVLVDVDDDMHMDPDDIERKITANTKAILVVHMRGQAGNLGRILEIATERCIPIVEDAVPILGARIGNKYIGTFGAFGAFSTQSDKSLNTGEGGFILTDDSTLFERAVLLSGAYEGRVKKHCNWEMTTNDGGLPLYNFRMDEIRGAIACSQLEKLPNRLEAMRNNYDAIIKILAKHSELKVRKSHYPEATLGDNVIFRLENSDPVDAQWFADALSAEGIDARSFGPLGAVNARSFWNWGFMFPGKSRQEIRALLPQATHLLDQTIDVPLSPMLDDDDIADFERAIAKILRERQIRLSNASAMVEQAST